MRKPIFWVWNKLSVNQKAYMSLCVLVIEGQLKVGYFNWKLKNLKLHFWAKGLSVKHL